MARYFSSIILLFIAVLLAGCGGGSSGQGTGVLAVQVTDAKVDEAQAVVLHYTQVTIHGDQGDVVVPVHDPVTGDPGRRINLLDYTNGDSTVLFEHTLPAGHYSWMRLDVDFDPTQSYIEIDGGMHQLHCTSCQNNGVMLNHSFRIDADQTTAFTLDFDLRSSITMASGMHYIRPTVRVVDTAASGAIAGSVDPTLIASLGSDGTGCAVYVFDGENATLDDIYMPMSGMMSDMHHHPVITAMVDPDTLMYTAGFMPAGMYTVALTCDAMMDVTDVDDTLMFTGATHAPVMAGQTYRVNFGGGA